MDLQKGLQTHDSFLLGAIYILRLGEGGLGKEARPFPACWLSMSFPKCPLFPGLDLLAVVPLMPLLFGGAWGGLLNLIDFSTLISKWR